MADPVKGTGKHPGKKYGSKISKPKKRKKK